MLYFAQLIRDRTFSNVELMNYVYKMKTASFALFVIKSIEVSFKNVHV